MKTLVRTLKKGKKIQGERGGGGWRPKCPGLKMNAVLAASDLQLQYF